MKISTFNVDGFRNCNIADFIEILKTLVSQNDDILIVQEFPHMNYTKDSHWSTELLQEHIAALYAISNENFKVIFPRHLINSQQCTVAICLQNSQWSQNNNDYIDYDKKYSFGNKFVELILDNDNGNNIHLLGIHNPIDIVIENKLIQVFDNSRIDIILGDFNAHWNEHRYQRKSTWLYYLRNKFESYIDLVTDTMITFKPVKTTIDHIFIKKKLYRKVTFNGITETSISDHNLLSFSLDRFD